VCNGVPRHLSGYMQVPGVWWCLASRPVISTSPTAPHSHPVPHQWASRRRTGARCCVCVRASQLQRLSLPQSFLRRAAADFEHVHTAALCTYTAHLAPSHAFRHWHHGLPPSSPSRKRGAAIGRMQLADSKANRNPARGVRLRNHSRKASRAAGGYRCLPACAIHSNQSASLPLCPFPPAVFVISSLLSPFHSGSRASRASRA
jgi:hypothetical protein